MAGKPTYEELKQRVKELGKEAAERKRTEEALKESEQRFRELADLLPQPIFELDLEGIFTYSNRCGFETFGYSHQDLANGVNALELFIPEDRQRVWQNIQKRLTGIEFEDHEYTGLKKDGSTFPILIYSAPIVAKNKLVGVRGIVLDITERKRAEEALQKAHDELEMRVEERTADLIKANQKLKGEIEDRKQAEEALQRSELCLRLRNQINSIFLTYPDEEMYAQVLKVILEAMESKYGTFGYFDEVGSFVAPAVTREIYWEQCNVPEKDVIFEKGTFGGIWGRAIKEKKTLISNDGPFNTPKGHIPIQNTMVTPIIFHDEVISAIHIANKPNGYDEIDREILGNIADSIAPVLYARLQRDRKDAKRKKAEEALWDSRNMLQTVLDSIPAAVFWKDRDSIYLGGNRTWLASTGLNSSEEVVGKSDYELPWEKKQADSFREDDRKVIESGIPEYDIIEPYRRADDTLAWAKTNKVPLRDMEGNIVGVLGTYEDITERKQAEDALRESEERYRTLFEGAAEGILVADVETKEFKYANPAMCVMLGYTEEELKRMSVVDIHPKEALEHVISEFKAQAQGEKALAQNIPCLRKDGKTIYADIYTAKVLIDGRVCNVGLFTDITERKQVEEALREEAIRRRILVDQSRDGIVVLDENGKVFEANQRYADMLGYSMEEVLQLHVWDWDTQWTRQQLMEMLRTVDETGDHFETVHRRKDGTCYDVEISTNGAIFGEQKLVFCVCRDITERKRTQQELQKAHDNLEQRVEERTKKLRDAQEQLVHREKLSVLGQVAGGLAHELRNPLGAIRNTSYFLNMAIKDPEPQVKEALGILEKEVLTSESIIRGILDFTRREAPVRHKVDVNDILQAALSRVPVPNSVEFVSLLNETLPIITGDPEQLTQAFRNLIRNAVQAMPEGGRLAVRSEAPSPECVTVTFTDTGTGMDEETLGKVFEPLFTTKAKGIGLGLALTKMVIEAHRGTIDVESEVGKGTTFTVKLPGG